MWRECTDTVELLNNICIHTTGLSPMCNMVYKIASCISATSGNYSCQPPAYRSFIKNCAIYRTGCKRAPHQTKISQCDILINIAIGLHGQQTCTKANLFHNDNTKGKCLHGSDVGLKHTK